MERDEVHVKVMGSMPFVQDGRITILQFSETRWKSLQTDMAG